MTRFKEFCLASLIAASMIFASGGTAPPPGGPARASAADKPKVKDPTPTPTPVPVPTPAPISLNVQLKGDTTINQNTYFDLSLTNLPDTKAGRCLVWWDLLNGEADCKKTMIHKTRMILNGPPNTYKLRVRISLIPKDENIDADTQEINADLVIKGLTPPPGPTPTPTPGPGPTPTPGVSPIDGTGLRVLIVYDETDKSSLTSKQLGIITGKAVRDYLNAKTAKGSDGSVGYRIWDKSTDATDDLPEWGKALGRALKDPKFKAPWVLIANGKDGYEGPMPATPDDMIKLLDKYSSSSSRN